MDVLLDANMNIYVNNMVADRDTKVYENFSVVWTMEEITLSDIVEKEVSEKDVTETAAATDDDFYFDEDDEVTEEAPKQAEEKTEEQEAQPKQEEAGPMYVVVNGRPITMSGKSQFIFVDIFDYIDMDLSKPQGAGIVTNINGRPAQYMEALHAGDVIEVYWRK